jgi:hypothetical protein
MTLLPNRYSCQEFIYFISFLVHPDTPLEMDNLHIKIMGEVHPRTGHKGPEWE